jgi:hypothetical protein
MDMFSKDRQIHGIFFPAILSAVVFFRNTTAGGKIPCLKIDCD